MLKHLARNPIVASFCLRGGSIALKSLQILVLVRLYGSETFGIYSIALGVFNFAMVFARLGLDHFSLREATSASNADYVRLLRISRFMALPGLVAALSAQLLVWHIYAWDVAMMFVVLLAAAPFYAVTWNHIFVLRGSGRINLSLVIFEILNPLFLMLGALLLRGQELGLALAFLGATLATLALSTHFAHRSCEDRGTDVEEPKTIRNSVSESRSFFASSIFEAVQTLADGLFVGYFLRPIDAALYAIVTRMSGIVLMPIAILTIYMKITVAQLRGEPLARIWQNLRIYTFASIVVSLALWAVLVAIAPWIGLLFAVDFPSEALWAYVAVVTARALQGGTSPVAESFFMSGRERYVARTNLVLLVPYLGSLLAFGPPYGLLGVGLVVLGNALVSRVALILILVLILRRQPQPLATI